MTAKPYYPAAVLLFAVAIPAAAQTPSGLGDLVGARAAGGEQSLQSRGYHYVKTQKSDDRSYSYWWNPARQLCVTVATMDGRYDSITPSPAPDCDQSAARDGRSHGGTPHDDGRDIAPKVIIRSGMAAPPARSGSRPAMSKSATAIMSTANMWTSASSALATASDRAWRRPMVGPGTAAPTATTMATAPK